MKESEIIQLLTVLQNTYNGFSFDRFKVELWRDLLQDTSFELAQSNLRRYVLDSANRFPPHPGILAEIPVHLCDSNYVPDAVETRKMLQQTKKLYLGSNYARTIPSTAKERMIQLGYKSK